MTDHILPLTRSRVWKTLALLLICCGALLVFRSAAPHAHPLAVYAAVVAALAPVFWLGIFAQARTRKGVLHAVAVTGTTMCAVLAVVALTSGWGNVAAVLGGVSALAVAAGVRLWQVRTTPTTPTAPQEG